MNININYRSHQCHNWLPVQCVSYQPMLLRNQAQYFSNTNCAKCQDQGCEIKAQPTSKATRETRTYTQTQNNHGIVALAVEPLAHVTNAWGVLGQLQHTSFFVTRTCYRYACLRMFCHTVCIFFLSACFIIHLVVFCRDTNTRITLWCVWIRYQVCVVIPSRFPHSLLLFLYRLETDASCRKHLRIVVSL